MELYRLYRSSPWKATGQGDCALCPRSHSTKLRTSWLRHIQVGKRENAVHGAAGGLPARTCWSMRAASGQSASMATKLKPLCRMSSRVMRSRMR